MAKTRFFRIAVEGATTDGRVIERNWIEEMAAGYNPETYTATINCEHIRGYSPEAPFNSYGKVLALKAEEVELDLDGKKQKRLALFAEIDANDQLLAINKQGQKLFTSCEIAPNFAGTGKAGLVGLAVTDNPASLGTEMLQFAAAKPMFDARKKEKDNLFSASEEAAIELAPGEEPAKGEFASFFTGLTDFLKNFGKDAEREKEPEPKPNPANDNDPVAKLSASIADGFQKMSAAVEALSKDTDARFKKLSDAHDDLVGKLENTPASKLSRQPAPGGGNIVATDC